MGKRYYWLKLKSDFFSSKRIKKLRNMAGGDTYTIIYLKMQLLAIKTDGILTWTGLEDNFAEELALDMDEKPDDVEVTLLYLLKTGLAETKDNRSFYFPYAVENTGSETAAAQRMRDFRSRQEVSTEIKKLPKTNAERQQLHRAKENCTKQKIPYVEDSQNNKRYNGYYYLVCQREKYRCALCGGTDNLCVHHIDGFDETKPENSEYNKMILLCRVCHQRVHRSGLKIPDEILDSIGYFSNETNTVTPVLQSCYVEKEIEKETEIEAEKESEGCDPALAKVFDFAFSRINPSLSQGAISDLKFFYELLGADVTIHAMQVALDEKKTAWSYIRAILNRYRREGLDTLQKVMEAEEKRNAQKTGKVVQKEEPKPVDMEALKDLLDQI